MNNAAIKEVLLQVEAETDPNLKALILAGLVSELFREEQFEPIVVGGSAIEFYTDGAYLSGDIDICFDSPPPVPGPEQRATIMAGKLGATGTTRSWRIGGLYVDLLGEIEFFADKKFGSIETPSGQVLLIPVEDLVVERVFIARGMSQPNDVAEDCARKLIAAILRDEITIDWKEAERIANSPAYRCLDPLTAMREEVAHELEKG